MREIVVKTESKFAYDEPDYKIHLDNYESDDKFELRYFEVNCSAGEDNSSSIDLIEDVISRFSLDESEKINWLDLGCGGGELILDVNKRKDTDICIGLDGSCGVYKQKNWQNEKNKKVLNHADLTKEFFVQVDGKTLEFDVISCSEVIEHFSEDQLDTFFTNVFNHLSDKGIFYGSIALFPDTRDINGYYEGHPKFDPNSELFVLHKTVYETKEPWDKIMEKYFNILEYDFDIKMRNHHNSYYFMCSKKV
jgi:cyclopropane fatty-acyl-phospholipid synthase-like methyltransferase